MASLTAPGLGVLASATPRESACNASNPRSNPSIATGEFKLMQNHSQSGRLAHNLPPDVALEHGSRIDDSMGGGDISAGPVPLIPVASAGGTMTVCRRTIAACIV